MDQENKPIRRYPEGLEFYFDITYGTELIHSKVLNENYQVGELDGLLSGKQKRLQMLEDELEDHITAQKQSKQIEFNRGRKYVEDDRSREKRLTLEARIDVCKWENEHLKKAIEEAEQQEDKHEELPCMPRGPLGLNQVRGSTGTGFIDGQYCTPVDGMIVISDQRSPYRGMAVMDYTAHISQPWKFACRKHNKQRRKQLLESGVKEEQLKRRYSLPLPEWPANVKNYLNGTPNSEPKDAPPRKMMRRRK